MLLWRFAILAHPAGPDEPWPGKEELEAFAARCEAGSFTSYVGIPYERSSLAVSWGQPTGPSWLDGARSITCMLARLDGEQLTASMRHTGGLTAIATDPLFTVADLPGIVLQTYEAPAGTEHEYSMAMSGDEFRTAIAAGPDQAQEVTWAFWALFATPGSQHPDGSGPVVTDTAAYSISAQTLESPKAASIKLHAAFRETTSIAADPVTLPAEIGDESWAVATPDSELSDYSCLWRMGNLVVAMTADGPAADPAVMLEMAEAMAARAAGAAAPPRPAPSSAEEQAIWETDAALIAALLDGESVAWAESVEAGIRYEVDHAHPALELAVDACLDAWLPDGPADIVVEYRFDPATAIRDDGWTLSDGPLAGRPIDGRIYEVEVTETVREDGMAHPARLRTHHVAIVDGEAYGFLTCDT